VSTNFPRFDSTPRPPCPTVAAIAAPIPIGANFITSPVNLNMTSATPSQNPSMTSLGRPFTCDSASANSTAQKTICSTSLCTAASKKLCGTICSSTVVSVGCSPRGEWMGAPAAGGGRRTPSPGRTRFTASKPTPSARVVTTSK